MATKAIEIMKFETRNEEEINKFVESEQIRFGKLKADIQKFIFSKDLIEQKSKKDILIDTLRG